MAAPAPIGAGAVGPCLAAGAAALAAWDGHWLEGANPELANPDNTPGAALLAVHVACALAFTAYHNQWAGLCLEDVLGNEPWATAEVVNAAYELRLALEAYALR